MTVPRILATSGGFLPTDRWGVLQPGGLVAAALRLSGADRPRVCLVLTASGDSMDYLARSYAALAGMSCDVTHLAVFPQPNTDPEQALLSADVIWVGGGSVANLLALWRLHGIDTLLRAAWERGTVLAGVSAGSICWHVGGPTDSFGPTLRPVLDGLALLPYGNGVHYDSEPQRRPLVHRLVADGTLPVTYATDDGIGILYQAADPVAVLSDFEPMGGWPARPAQGGVGDPADPAGPAAYRVTRVGAGVLETRLPVGPIRG